MMIDQAARLLERRFGWRYEFAVMILRWLVVVTASAAFLLIATLIVAFDTIFPGQGDIASIQVGGIASEDVYAPAAIAYDSAVLTDQARQAARDAVRPVFDPPDPAVARERSDLTAQIIDYIDHIRRDRFASEAQQASDLRQIRELTLDDTTIAHLLSIDEDTWQQISAEIVAVLERVMVLRGEIRETDLPTIRAQLPNQVYTFEPQDAAVVVSFVSQLIRPNTTRNDAATLAAQEDAADAVPTVRRAFAQGQLVISAGTEIATEDYEALEALGLLASDERQVQSILRALLASTLVMVVIGLFLLRFRPELLYFESRFLTLLAAIFLITLLGARLGLSGQIYIYPTAALALLFVTVTTAEVAVIATLGLALLVGLMANSSLEIAVLVTSGGLIGALTLRSPERLNSFFFAGFMVAMSNISTAAIFNAGIYYNPTQLALLTIYGLLNGILTSAAAIAGMYILTLIFNLPTALKLVELSQPNQPLLQRLLREAPGTYQHTLQVANLAEQAANQIGANAELTHTAALYHDIGKMLNPAFFTENQQDIGNPHDTLNDPYRSADIIISHVTGGDDLARQYRLPQRIRDFIREHHGTMRVYVFYKQAVLLAGGDGSAVDAADFTYAGPKPRSRETAILMLADGCEAAVRARQPRSRQEITEIVREVIEDRRKSGQLDDSGLTLNDLKAIETIFVDLLQASFHPRINYEEAVSRVRRGDDRRRDRRERLAPPPVDAPSEDPTSPDPTPATAIRATASVPIPKLTDSKPQRQLIEMPAADDDDDSPMAEVPRLRRTTETRPPVLNGVRDEAATEDPAPPDLIPAEEDPARGDDSGAPPVPASEDDALPPA